MKQLLHKMQPLGRRFLALMLAVLILGSTLPALSYALGVPTARPTQAAEAPSEPSVPEEEEEPSKPAEQEKEEEPSQPAEQEKEEEPSQPSEPEEEEPNVQDQLNALLDDLTVYIGKTPFTQEDLAALNSGLEQVGLFCAENGIAGLTEEQQDLWNQLAQATMQPLDEPYVAEITGSNKLYASLKDAVFDADPGDTVKILRDLDNVSFTISTYDVPDGSPITLDLNGKTLRLGSYEDSITIEDGAVVIQNGTIEATSLGSLIDNFSSELTLTNVKLIQNNPDNNCAALYCYSYCGHATATLSGGTTVTAPVAISTNYQGLVNIESASIFGDIQIDGGKLLLGSGASLDRSLSFGDMDSLPDITAAHNEFPISGNYCWEDNTEEGLPYRLAPKPVASFDGEKFPSLQEAVWAAAPGGTVELLGSDTVTTIQGPGVDILQPLVLELNEMTYQASGNCAFSLYYEATRSANTNSVVIQNGTLSLTPDDYDFHALIFTDRDLLLQNVNLDGSRLACALFWRGGNVTIAGGSVSGKIFVDFLDPAQGDTLDLSGTTLNNCSLQLENYPSGASILKAAQGQEGLAAPEGYRWEPADVEGKCRLVPDIQEVAAVSGCGSYDGSYGSLQDALDAVNEAYSNGETGEGTSVPVVSLLEDVTGEPISIYVPLILDLDDHTYTKAASFAGSVVYVDAYGDSGQVHIRNGSIASENNAILVESYGWELTLEGVTLEQPKGRTNAALSCLSGIVSIGGGTELTAASGGLAIAISNTDVTVNNAAISGDLFITGSDSSLTVTDKAALSSNAALLVDSANLPELVTKPTGMTLGLPTGFSWKSDTENADHHILDYDEDAAEAVAEVTGCEGANGTYPSLQEAVSAIYNIYDASLPKSRSRSVTGSPTIKLLKDCTGGEVIINAPLTLDLNGCTYTVPNGTFALAVEMPATITSSAEKKGTILLQSGYTTFGAAHELKLSNVILDGSNAEYALNWYRGNVTMENAAILGRICVTSEAGHLDLSGGDLSRCGGLDIDTFDLESADVTKAEGQDLPIRSNGIRNYCWRENRLALDSAGGVVAWEFTKNGDHEEGTADSLEEALWQIDEIESERYETPIEHIKLTLLADAETGSISFNRSTTLDLNSNCLSLVYHSNQRMSGSGFATLEFDGDSTIQNGTIYSRLSAVDLVNYNALDLKDVIMDLGSVSTLDDTPLTLACLENSRTTLSGTTSFSGNIVVYDGAILSLNANVDPASNLAVLIQEKDPTVTRPAGLSGPAAPVGYDWDKGETVDTLVRNANAITVTGPDGNELTLESDGKILSLNDVISLVPAGSTITLKADAVGGPLVFAKDVTLDLGKFSYGVYSDGENSTAVTVEPFDSATGKRVNVTIQSDGGTILPADPGIDCLVDNAGNLTLASLKLAFSQTNGSEGAVVCRQGSLNLSGTTITVPAGRTALELSYSGTGTYNDIVRTALSGSGISGNILVQKSGTNHTMLPTDMMLQLNDTAVNGALRVSADLSKEDMVTITRGSGNKTPLAPEGWFWKNDQTLTRVYNGPNGTDITNAVAVSFSGSSDDPKELVYYPDLKTALQQGGQIRLLKQPDPLEEDLVISSSVSLDLNGFTLSGSGLKFTSGNSRILNGKLEGLTKAGTYLHLAGGSVTVQDVTMRAPTLPACGVLVEGAGARTSRFAMEGASALHAGATGIRIQSGGADPVVNSVSIGGTSTVDADTAIAGNGSALSVMVSGGQIRGRTLGIGLTGGTFTAIGGEVTGGVNLSASDGNLTALLNGTNIHAANPETPAVRVSSANNYTATARYYAGDVSGIESDGNLGSTTQIRKGKDSTVPVSVPAGSQLHPVWQEADNGELKLALQPGLKITVNWVDYGEESRPEDISVQLQQKQKVRAVTAEVLEGTTLKLAADADGGSSWTHVLAGMTLEQIESLIPDPPEGYTTSYEITADGIVITNTLKAQDPTVTTIKHSYTYYVRKVRYKYAYGSYGSSGGSGGGGGGLLQTGQLNWPIPVMGSTGLLTLALGLYLLRKKNRYEEQ